MTDFTAENWKMLLGAWNRWTNIWLRETIYIRVARANRKPGFKSTLVTFVVSALWHGVNPAYYATFVLGSFIQSLAKQMRRFVRPLVAEPPPPDSNKQQTAAQRENTISAYLFAKSVYDVLGSALTQCMVNYIVVPFVMLDMNSSIDAVCPLSDFLELAEGLDYTQWRRVWFFGHWLTILPLLFFTLGGRIVLKSFAASRTAKAREPAPQTPTSDEPLLLGRDEDEELSEVVENKVDEQLRQRMPARRSEKEL